MPASSDTTCPEPDGSRNGWQTGPLALLVVGVAVAVVAGLGLGGRTSATGSAELDRLRLEGTAKVRAFYWLQNRFGAYAGLTMAGARGGNGLRELQRLAARERSDDACRMLAVATWALREDGWRKALVRMKLNPDRVLTDVDRELALWNAVLGDAPADQRTCREAERFVNALNLGWYQHVALAGLYERCGNTEAAARHRRAALDATDRLTVLLGITAVVGLSGSALLAVFGILWFVRRKAGRSVVLAAPLPRPAARALLYAGASYFAWLVVLRLASPLMTSLLGGVRAGSEAAIFYRAVANLVFAIVSLLLPAAILATLGRRIGLTAGDIGLRRPRALRDVLGGIAGYSAALPLLVISLLVSMSLFEPSTSRVNPAALDFARAHAPASRAALLVLASVVAPAVEEFIFRGILLRALQSYHGFTIASIVTSAVFALLHPQLPMGFLSIFVLGLVFSGLYGVTGSLWPSIIAHGINNGMVFAYLVLSLGG